MKEKVVVQNMREKVDDELNGRLKRVKKRKDGEKKEKTHKTGK